MIAPRSHETREDFRGGLAIYIDHPGRAFLSRSLWSCDHALVDQLPDAKNTSTSSPGPLSGIQFKEDAAAGKAILDWHRRSGQTEGQQRGRRQNHGERHATCRRPAGDRRRHPRTGHYQLRKITDELNRRDILTARGAAWHPTTTARLLARLA